MKSLMDKVRQMRYAQEELKRSMQSVVSDALIMAIGCQDHPDYCGRSTVRQWCAQCKKVEKAVHRIGSARDELIEFLKN
jgi:hypothetical protein